MQRKSISGTPRRVVNSSAPATGQCARPSIAPLPPSAQTSIGQTRMSTSIGLAPQQSSGRRSLSIGPPPKGGMRPSFGVAAGKVKDTRPLNDRLYQQRAAEQLSDFLVEHDYPALVTPNMFKNPTKSTVMNVMEFLLQRYDPDWKSAKKLEDELPLMLKIIG
jgi:SMC interacting uncharacterized protein involved in chromosome segregation